MEEVMGHLRMIGRWRRCRREGAGRGEVVKRIFDFENKI